VRFVLDCDAYVTLVEHTSAKAAAIRAADAGEIEFLMTHFQWDEIATLSDRDVRLSICEIPRRNVPTHRVIREALRSRVAVGPAPSDISSMIERGWNRDFLVSVTAQYEDAVLVTDDIAMWERATAEQVEVWTIARLIACLVSDGRRD
jgi:hypothetical protein